MKWASALSTVADTAAAAEEIAIAVRPALGPGPVDLLVVFLGAAHVAHAELAGRILKDSLSPGCFVASSSRGVIAGEREVESGPAIAAVAARLPDVTVSPFIVMGSGWREAGEDAMEFARMAPHGAGAELVLLFGDPFTLDVEGCLGAFNRQAPSVRLVGGMASAGATPGSNALLLNDWVAREGGVAVALSGRLRVDVVVSQGCRPIGPPLEVTRAQGNVLVELDGQPALERAEQVLRGLVEVEREQLKNGLYVGRPVAAGATGRGDYLIRNLLGADRERGLIAIGDHATERERIRLHVRDGRSAREDLELLLSPQSFDSKAKGALLFSCNGRGRGLYGVADGDIRTLQAALGESVPTAGMFCAGEIGPVGPRNFLHGHTASIAIVREAGEKDAR